MLDQEFKIQDTFPPVQYDEWRSLAEAALKGAPFEKRLVTHTYEGIDLQPVYTRKDQLAEGDVAGLPGLAPFVRGSSPLGSVQTGWDLRQEHSTEQLDVANEAILTDLQGGVTSLLLMLDGAARVGLDPDDDRAANLVGRGGIMAYHVNDLDAVLTDVHLSMVGIALDAGAAYLPAAAQLIALWRRRGIAPEEVRGAFNADPLSVPIRDGQLPLPLETALSQMADLAAWTSANYPNVTAVGVDTAPYHHAGATSAQDLAFAMATAVEYLRAMTGAGMTIDDAAQQVLFRISLGTHHYLAISKLRAARHLWSRVVESCGGTEESAAMQLHARMSDRVLTEHDPYVNMLRNTVSVFAAGIGGANTITSVPFDYTTGLTDAFSRRVARNTGLILQEESHLHRVVDPAGGSWFMENLTHQIAEKAWGIFQEIERQWGMISVLESGWVAEQIDSAFAPRAKDIATRKEGITGVSEFPDLEQQRIFHLPPDRRELRAIASERIRQLRSADEELLQLSTETGIVEEAISAAEGGATLGQLANALDFYSGTTKIQSLPSQRFAKPYEDLRDAGDAWEKEHGRRPCIFLANLGPVAHHTARATYAKSFFEAGGFEVVTNEGFKTAEDAAKAFAESGASIAVICSSDKLYPEFVPSVTSQLKAAGARTVILAGKPGDNEAGWRAAGVDRFIYISCNVLATLRELLEEEGVLTS